jgi:hypothetical protein
MSVAGNSLLAQIRFGAQQRAEKSKDKVKDYNKTKNVVRERQRAGDV